MVPSVGRKLGNLYGSCNRCRQMALNQLTTMFTPKLVEQVSGLAPQQHSIVSVEYLRVLPLGSLKTRQHYVVNLLPRLLPKAQTQQSPPFGSLANHP